MKNFVLAPFVLASIAISAHAVANDPISHRIQLQATIPSTDFYVEPVDSTWINTPQVLAYSGISKTIMPFKKAFNFKYSGGEIHAAIDGPAVLTDGKSNTIPLTVTFNTQALSTTPVSVVKKEEASKGGIADLQIAATTPKAAITPGQYVGNVLITFDAVVDAGAAK